MCNQEKTGAVQTISEDMYRARVIQEIFTKFQRLTDKKYSRPPGIYVVLITRGLRRKVEFSFKIENQGGNWKMKSLDFEVLSSDKTLCAVITQLAEWCSTKYGAPTTVKKVTNASEWDSEYVGEKVYFIMGAIMLAILVGAIVYALVTE